MVSDFQIERDTLPTLDDLAGAEGHHFALLRLLFRRVRNEKSAARFFRLLSALDDYAVM
jgi:hypothetical protein